MRRRPLFAALAAALLSFVACTSDTPSADDDPTPVVTAPSQTSAPVDAASILVDVDGYTYGDPPEAWRAAVANIERVEEESLDSEVRTVRADGEAVAVVWVTVVEQAQQLDDRQDEQLRQEAEADALAEYEGEQEAEAEVRAFGEARVVHTQPSNEPWPHIYIWPMKLSTTVRFMGDDADAIEEYIAAFVAAG